MDQPDGWLVTRQHVLDLLPVMRLTAAQQQRLLALRYPLPRAQVEPEFDLLGIDVDVLVDRMGGSP